MEEDRIPLATAVQVQYFDVSDAESSDLEEETADNHPAASAASAANNGGDDDDEELEVFDLGAAGGTRVAAAPVPRPPPEGGIPSRPVDPFGVLELRAAETAAASSAEEDPLAAAKKKSAQALTYFAGDGLAGGSSKIPAPGAGGDGEFDDEFDYAFDGEARQGETHKRVFDPSAVPVPKGLLTDVRSSALGSFAEGEEEEEGEEAEEEEIEPQLEEEEEEGEEMASEPGEAEEAAADPWAVANAQVEEGLLTAPTAAETIAPAAPQVQPSQELLTPLDSAFSAAVLELVDLDFSSALTEPPKPEAGFEVEGVVEAEPTAAGLLDLDEIDPLFGDDAPVAAISSSSAPQPSQMGEAGSRYSVAAEGGDDEWEDANRHVGGTTAAHDSQQPTDKPHKARSFQALMSSQALSYFASLDVGPYVGQIVEEESEGSAGEGGLWSRILAFLTCSGSTQLYTAELKEERRRLFCYAKMPFDNSDDMHETLLSSIFYRFTSQPPAGRYGTHWELIGFQGNDPATDLRGCGMLGLLQLLNLWDANPENAAEVYRLSQDAVQEFPLAVVGMNITKWSLQVLRAGKIHPAANRSGSVTSELTAFYLGTWYHFYQTWVERSATMRDSGYVLKDVEGFCKANVSNILKISCSATLTNR